MVIGMGSEVSLDQRAFTPPSPAVDFTRGGEPLDRAVRADLEPRFGFDFRQVRIHRDAQAECAAVGLGASAFTLGSHIAFGRGAYAPQTSAGRDLLAHELTHVVQQSGGESPQWTVGEPCDRVEAEADQHRPVSAERPRIRRKVSPEIEKLRKLLGYTFYLKDTELREVLNLLRPLPDEDLRHTLAVLGPKATTRIFSNVTPADREADRALLDRISDVRGASLIAFKSPDPEIPTLAAEPGKGAYALAAPFKSLDELVAQVERTVKGVAGGPAQLSRLGILAHGDFNGEVQIGSDLLNLKTIGALRGKLLSLNALLARNADVYLYGCVAGGSAPGSALLKELSLILPGRRIIGFNTVTRITIREAKLPGQSGFLWPNIKATKLKARLDIPAEEPLPDADEAAPQAKAARDGKIVKWPADEVNNQSLHDQPGNSASQFQKSKPR